MRALQAVIGFFARAAQRVTGCDLALIDRNVHEHVRAGDVADRVDIRIAGLPILVDVDARDVVARNPDVVEAQSHDIRNAAETI